MTTNVLIGLGHGGTGASTPTAARTNLGISGTTGTLTKFNTNSTLVDSILVQSGNDISSIGKISAATLEASRVGGLSLKDSSGSNQLTIFAPTAIPLSYSLTFPAAPATATSFVKVASNGALSYIPEVPLVLTSSLPAGTIQVTAAGATGRAISATGAVTSTSTLEGVVAMGNAGGGNVLYLSNTGPAGGQCILAENKTLGGRVMRLTGNSSSNTNQGSLFVENTSGGSGTAVFVTSSDVTSTGGSNQAPTITGGGSMQVVNTNANTIDDNIGIAITARATGSVSKTAIACIGNVLSHATPTFSSQLLKNTISESKHAEEDVISILKSIPLYKYTYKDGSYNNAPIYGIVAEHLNEVFPQSVHMDSYTFIPNLMVDVQTEFLHEDETNSYFIYKLIFDKEASSAFDTIVNEGEISLTYGDGDGKRGAYAAIIKKSELELEIQSLVELPSTVFAYGTYEKCPSVNKNMVFELALIALQNALKRIEVLEAKNA